MMSNFSLGLILDNFRSRQAKRWLFFFLLSCDI